MNIFKLGQRVRVRPDLNYSKEPENEWDDWLLGRTGTVVRCRIADSGAWVKMDEPIPEKIAKFPKDDDRRNHVLLYPTECVEAKD
jgi:hypothetical protein